MFDGSSSTDSYMAAWEWGEYTEIEGSAVEAANQMAERFNSGFPRDFVARVHDLQDSGKRDPSPGAVDHWLE